MAFPLIGLILGQIRGNGVTLEGETGSKIRGNRVSPNKTKKQ